MKVSQKQSLTVILGWNFEAGTNARSHEQDHGQQEDVCGCHGDDHEERRLPKIRFECRYQAMCSYGHL